MALTLAAGATGTLARPRFDRDAGALVGSHCANCDARSWPARAVCSSCGRDSVGLENLPQRGRLLSYTTVWVPRPGLTAPYVLGQVDLGHGATIFAHIRSLPEGVQAPLPVTVVLSPDPERIPSFWFEPAK
jgi:uncharacterized OB-fold protein